MTDPQQPDGSRPPFAPPVPPAPRADGSIPGPNAAPSAPPASGGHPAPGAFVAPSSHAPTGAYQAPVGAYQAPAGGYQSAAGPYEVPAPPAPQSRTTGVLSLILSLAAAVVIPILGAVAAWEIGRRLPGTVDALEPADMDSLAFLAPARDQVLWAEVSFWTGTVLGIVAFILGILAIVKRRGRGMGIAGIVGAVIGPVIFFTAVFIALSIGAAVGSAELYGI
ncbi:hypothetical protein OED01_10950 [Microbacterium sp. M28]|uniref:hypothetical protein n=1 Tax=Microbacterium sp. M28 TaxID=2962064 RepID=UPI0021F4974B|nr:hypothetical protein [Microbacterium sp. M28]UYO96122.1 hypothetical protein OED01_10950 [Microbacterium sp. M28]